MNKVLIWLDDSRNPFEYDWLIFSPIIDYTEVVWIKNFIDLKKYLKTNSIPYAICLDYDLDINEEYNGLDCVNYLIECCRINKDDFPLYNFQSANEYGRDVMLKRIKDYRNERKID